MPPIGRPAIALLLVLIVLGYVSWVGSEAVFRLLLCGAPYTCP